MMITPKRWTDTEDDALRAAIREQEHHTAPNWVTIASRVPGRSNKDCRKRWAKIDDRMRKGAWASEEDERLREAIDKFGFRWSVVSKAVGNRSADQCQKRYRNALNPELSNANWSADEDATLISLVTQMGRNWSAICENHFPHRSPLSLSNR
ncbi:hypothetical protein K469DRAFT_491100, partial [Zopfia rhizophila CBS 207.26]